MNEKKQQFKRKRTFVLLMAMAMNMVFIFTACSSGKVEMSVSETDTTKEETVKKEVEEASTPEPTAEPTPEPTLEPTPVPTPDTESTLPGVEWIQTFNGMIDEPKLVVFNDETNKKIILEDFQEVEFTDDDTLAVYIPDGKGEVTKYYDFEEVEYFDSVVVMRKITSVIARGGYSCPTIVELEFDGQPMELYCGLKLVG